MIPIVLLALEVILPALLAQAIYKWMTRVKEEEKHYQEYSNAVVASCPHENYGDFASATYTSTDQVFFHIQSIKNNPDADIFVKFDYNQPDIYLSSMKALREFKNLFPEKIDRDNQERLSFGKCFTKSFEMRKTDEEWKARRQVFFRGSCFKNPQALIGDMIDTLEDYIEETSPFESFDLIEFFEETLTYITLEVLFGEKFFKKIGKVKYKKKNGSFSKIKFKEAFGIILQDCMDNGNDAVTSFLPWVNVQSSIEPYKRDQENVQELHRVLQKYLTKNGTKDLKSYKYFGTGIDEDAIEHITADEILHDVCNLIDSASGTLMYAIPSCLLLLKRFSCITTLREELAKTGFIKECWKKDGFDSEEGQSTLYE